MRKIARILICSFLLCVLSNCEKDDICVDGNTPLLVIGFYDVNDTTVFKAVSSLRIRELSVGDSINDVFEEGLSFHQDRTTVNDSTEIPLNVGTSSSQYEFILDSAADDETGAESGTIDTLTFNYTVVEDFISRGCGFVANYTDLDTTRNVFSTDWIKRITVVDSNITASNQIHVKIFH